MDKTELMEKYYTPTIEEFRVGFEYECKHEDEWIEEIVHNDSFMSYFDGQLKDGNIRVKLLDPDDILECGFKEWCKEDVYEAWDKDERYWQLHIGRYGDREDGAKALNLYEGNEGVGGRSQNILIWCKNKSEFKKLMNHLGIT